MRELNQAVGRTDSAPSKKGLSRPEERSKARDKPQNLPFGNCRMLRCNPALSISLWAQPGRCLQHPRYRSEKPDRALFGQHTCKAPGRHQDQAWEWSCSHLGRFNRFPLRERMRAGVLRSRWSRRSTALMKVGGSPGDWFPNS